ncbi:hypothetical protein Ahy_B04g071057 isoform C [Arachis hypogaea]|uniref:Uncharacterized protein n=1 Tax=Arachis hypogaea TaxID=3818 RepID=A0A444ZJX5_ARAHY|nr:hypothetical protein Ahy_B04g071057 isoform C [Arachis hypogaea]
MVGSKRNKPVLMKRRRSTIRVTVVFSTAARSAPPFLAIRGHWVVRASSSFKLYRHLFSLLQAVSPRLSYCRRSSTAFESAPVAVPAVPPPWQIVAAIATRRIVSIASPLFHFCRAATVPSGSNRRLCLLVRVPHLCSLSLICV